MEGTYLHSYHPGSASSIKRRSKILSQDKAQHPEQKFSSLRSLSIERNSLKIKYRRFGQSSTHLVVWYLEETRGWSRQARTGRDAGRPHMASSLPAAPCRAPLSAALGQSLPVALLHGALLVCFSAPDGLRVFPRWFGGEKRACRVYAFIARAAAVNGTLEKVLYNGTHQGYCRARKLSCSRCVPPLEYVSASSKNN